MPQITTVLLTAKGDLRKANLKLQDNNELTLDSIQSYFRKKESPERICYYEYDNKVVFIFGYKTGKKDKISIVKLPQPYENIELYGDSLVIVSLDNKWQNPISYSIEQWNSFYTKDTADIGDTSNTGKKEISKMVKKSATKLTTKVTKTVTTNEIVESTKEIINKSIIKTTKQLTKKAIEDSDSEGGDENESENESDDDVLSDAGTEKSVKDDYADDSDSDSLSIGDISDEEKEEKEDEENDKLEAEPIIVRKRKSTVLTAKIDANNFKDDIIKESSAESNKLRMLCLKSFSFLEDKFLNGEIRKLEQDIFETALHNSEKHYIPKNWKCPQFIELYRQIVRSVMSNIHPSSPVSNPRLLKRVQEGEFELSSIPSMTSYEMFPEKWFTLRDKQLQREQKILEGNKSRATDQFKCRRCNKRECTYYELQTRSADEPMTIFITCLNCGKEWRQGG